MPHPVRNARWMVPVSLVFLLTAQGCPSSTGSPGWGTRTGINDIREAIQIFEASRGRRPEKLQDLCAEPRSCAVLPTAWRNDGWGTPFEYVSGVSDYEVRSSGPDRVSHTADDVVFSPLREQAQVAETAGCYAVDLTRWRELSGQNVVLDTAMHRTGFYRALPVISGREGSWFRQADSVHVFWIRAPTVTHIVFDRTTGVGYWARSGDAGRRSTQAIQAVRGECRGGRDQARPPEK